MNDEKKEPQAATPELAFDQHTKRLAFSYAKRHGVFIKKLLPDYAMIAHRPQPSLAVLTELRRFLNCPLKLEEIAPDEFVVELARAYETDTSAAMEVMLGMEETMDPSQLMQALPKTQDLLESEDDAPIIRLINAVLTQAIKQNASDVHIEPFEERLLIRYRIDGILREVLEPPRILAPMITSRVKVMAKLDIAEKRLPQDGRISLRIAGRAVDVRVSTIPSSHGERVVLRILDKQAARLDLSHLGMPPVGLKIMQQIIARPHGIILVTGPTGSGKTTTLYATLSDLNDESRNILTVEDPIEYYLPGIGQTQVNPKVAMTFAKGLRAILRQDPDVVMVGEIRDLETAEIAIQASLTGHLVLSTLHTNSAIGAITRLRDMGAETFLLSTTIIGLVAQRLVRLICKHCKQTRSATKIECEQLRISGKKAPQLAQPAGCTQCHGTGYLGRSGIYEIIKVDEKLREMIHNNNSEANMENYAHKSFLSIQQDGFRRVLAGDTTLEEVLRVTTEG